MEGVGYQTWATLGGVLQLHGTAFAGGLMLPGAHWIALAVVAAAGFSEAIAQSVVLFANKVKKARFVLSLAVSALLYVASYAFLVGSTWLILRYLLHAHFSAYKLAVVMAFTATPLIFSFLGALPYLGVPIQWLLRAWHLLAIVVGISATAHISAEAAFLCAALGWLFKAVAEQTFGSFIAKAGANVLDAAAGVRLHEEARLQLETVMPGSAAGELALLPATSGTGVKTPATSSFGAFAGIAFMLGLGYVVELSLRPLHHVVFGWQKHLPEVLQLPFELVWLGVIALVVGGFMAPLETLEWWAGWYGDGIQTFVPAAGAPVVAASLATRYVAYLDGISQSSSRYTSDIETFLDALAPILPAGVVLVRGIMAYSAINRPLDDDPLLAWFWRFIDKLRFANQVSLLGMIVNLRNVLIVAVSADKRYGPLYNHGVAQVLHDALVAHGYRPGSRTPITLIGYSGGGRMAAAAGPILHAALRAPVDVISLGGVISGACHFAKIGRFDHMFGTKDRIEPLGPMLFPTRWKIAFESNWNKAVRAGRLRITSLGPVGHQVPGGMLDPAARMPDGRTNLQQTLDRILEILQETRRFRPVTVPRAPTR